MVLGLIHQLYAIESELKKADASPAEILATRAAKSAPIIDAFEEFIMKDYPAEMTPRAWMEAQAKAADS